MTNEEFRAAMSRLAAGVVLVTAQEPPLDPDDPRAPAGEDAGMTATAFMSVSLDPPLALVSLREGSRMDDLLAEQPLWAVSVLADSQHAV
ncbi:flavin reductase family protein, partial [Streptomyces sp. CoT10]